MLRIGLISTALAAAILAAPTTAPAAVTAAPPVAQESRQLYAVLYDVDGNAIGLARYNEIKGGGRLVQELSVKIEDGQPGTWAIFIGSRVVGFVVIGEGGAGSAVFGTATGAILPRPIPGDIIMIGNFARGMFQQSL